MHKCFDSTGPNSLRELLEQGETSIGPKGMGFNTKERAMEIARCEPCRKACFEFHKKMSNLN